MADLLKFGLVVVVLSVVAYGIFMYYQRYHKVYSVAKIKNKFVGTENPLLKNIDDTYKYIYNYADIIHFNQQNLEPQDVLFEDADDYDEFEDHLFVIDPPDNINPLQQPHLLAATSTPQNVHDSFVQKKITSDYQKKKDSPVGCRQEDLQSMIISFVKDKSLRNTAGQKKISDVLDKIHTRNSYISNLSDTEWAILGNVWKDGNDQVKAELINQLDDCVDTHNVLYCPTGISTRILESVYIVNPNNYPKTKEVINQEMLNTAANLRNKFPDLEPAEFKQNLIKKYESDYKDLMTKKEILKQVDDWIDYL